MFGDLRPGVAAAEQDVGIGLVVAKKDIEAGLEALYQVAFKQQGLGFGFGDDDFHRAGRRNHALNADALAAAAGIGGDPLLQALRLTDIEHRAGRIDHAVNTGCGRHALERRADRDLSVGQSALVASLIGAYRCSHSKRYWSDGERSQSWRLRCRISWCDRDKGIDEFCKRSRAVPPKTNSAAC